MKNFRNHLTPLKKNGEGEPKYAGQQRSYRTIDICVGSSTKKHRPDLSGKIKQLG